MKTAISALLLFCTLAGNALAHELQDNRATLVLRDRVHLSLTLFVDYPRVLHQLLAPQQNAQEFMLQLAAMKPQTFQDQLDAAQRKLQSDTVLTLFGGKAAKLTQWVWPQAAVVQNLIQQRAMQAVVAPGDHTHAVQSEIRAETQSGNPKDFASVTLQVPTQFGQVLVVSYQPKQVWLKPNTPLPTIAFQVN